MKFSVWAAISKTKSLMKGATDMTKVIIRVEGGLVQAVYSDGDVDVEVVDLDVSDFPEEGEQEAADKRREEMEATIKQEGWKEVW